MDYDTQEKIKAYKRLNEQAIDLGVELYFKHREDPEMFREHAESLRAKLELGKELAEKVRSVGPKI